jgi:hypothetical protein
VRIKVVLLLMAVLSVVGCASNSAKTEDKAKASGMPEITVDAPEKRVKATIHF